MATIKTKMRAIRRIILNILEHDNIRIKTIKVIWADNPAVGHRKKLINNIKIEADLEA